ncbi:nuclear receptor-binding protein isoform X1 [Ambystoma mexicanum]|uniref:nuclear receptor-binding protein isoform X1 n=1 Tax=Ambystoma mexicanum TaxID=8296 RepID=UPI0037E8C2EA
MVGLTLQRLDSWSKERRKGSLRNCYKKRKKEDCSVVRDSRDGTVAIIEEVHGGRVEATSSPITQVVTAFKKVFHFLVQSVGRTPSTETCQLCGNVVSKNCAVFLSSSERSSAMEAKGKNPPPNSLKKAWQGEHLKSCRLNPKRKSTARNTYSNSICHTEPSTPSVTSSDKDLLSSAHSRLRKPPVERESSESSCSSKCSSQIHAHNSPRDTAIKSPSNEKLKELLCSSGKTSQTGSLHVVAPESARSASSGYESSDTSSLPNSVCSISKVYYESGHTDLSNAPVLLQQHASDQVSSCSDVEDLPSCHSECMTHYSGRSTTHSHSSSPSERPSFRAIGQSDSNIDDSISSVSDDDVHGICTSSASQSMPPNDAESSCVKGGQLSSANYPSSLASSSHHDSLAVSPIGCLLQEAQAAKLSALMRRRALYPVHGLPAPIAKSQKWATLKECQANGNKGQPTIGILFASQSSNNVLTSSNEESGQSFMNVPKMGTPCTCSTTMQRLEAHLNRKSLQNIWGMPTTIQKSHILYTPPAPTTIESRAIKKTFKTVPVALETLPFLRENTRQGLDSHLSKLASGRRMGLPSKIQESIRKCITSAPCASQSASRSDREKAPLLLKSGQPSNMPRDCGAKEANPKGFKQMPQDSSVPKGPPACITSYAGSPESWQSQFGSHPSIVGRDLQKCSIIANESKSRETVFPVPNQLKPELTCKAQPHLKPRALFAPHLSTSKTECLERNIKHKKLAFLWSLSDSLATFKPKVTGLPAFTQSCAAPINRLPFMKPNLRGMLVWPPEELHGDMLSCHARKHPQWNQKPVIKVSTTKDTTLISRNSRNILKSRFKIGIGNQKSEFLGNAPIYIRRHFPRNWPETELLSDTSEKKFPCHSIANRITQTPKTPYHCKEIEYSARSEIGSLHKQQPIDRSPQGLNGWKTHQGGFDETGLEAQASQGKRLRDNESSSPESCLPKRAFKGQRFMRQRITSILGQAATDNLEHSLMQKHCVAFGEFLAHSAQAWSPKALRPVQTTASGSSIMLREKELPFVESKPGGSQQGHAQRKSPLPDKRMTITLRQSVTALPPADLGPLKQGMKESFFHKGQSSATLLHQTTSSTDSTESLVIHVGNGSSDTKVESVSSEDSGQMVTEDTELPAPNVANRRSRCLVRTNLGDVGYAQRDITHTDMNVPCRPPTNSMPFLYKMAAKETSVPPELKSVEAIVQSSETYDNTRQVLEALEAFDDLRKIQENEKLQTTNPQQSSRTITPPTPLQSPPRECLNKESEVHINQADICFLSKNTKNLLEEHIANQIFQKNQRPSSNMLDTSVNVMPAAPDISKSSLSLSPLDSLPRKCTSRESVVSSTIDMPYTDTNEDTHESEDDTGLSLPHKDESMAVCSRRLAHESTDLVRPCYETLKFILKNVRLKLNHFGKRPLQSRTTFLPFADHNSIDVVEWNLKQKHLKCLLGIPPAPQGVFQEIMVNGSILQPPTPRRTANVQFSEMEIDFLNPNERALLEQHILRMMMDYEWGLSNLLQRSPQECVAKAPQLERMKTCPQTEVEIVLVREEAAFVPKTTRKDLELHTKKRMMNHDVGLPTRVVKSFAQFFPPAPLSNALLSDEATVVNISECTISTSPKQSKEYGTCAQFVAHSRNNMSIIVSSYKGASTQTSTVDGTKLNKQQTKKCLETQMVALPPMASKSQVFSLQEKGCLPQLAPVRATWQKPRVSLTTVIDPVSVPGLDLNQRHKLLAHLWGLPPMHLCSPWKPKPKESLLVPRGTLKEFSEMITSFLKPRVRDYLDCHIKRKMLQHEWGVPAFLQFSVHAFIPAAPMPAQPRTPLAAAIKLVIIRREAFFLNEHTRNHLETHVKQRIKPDTLGVPHKVLKALTAFHHVPPHFPAQVCRTEEENISGLYFALSGQANTGKNVEYIQEPMRIPQTRKRFVLAALDQLLSLDQNNLRRHLRKKCLEMRMEMLSSPVKDSMKMIDFLMKQTLPKSDKGGKLFVHSRSRCIPFLKIDSLCSLEKNIQHKHLMFLWGMPTLQKESVSRMVPSPFPSPHTHKGSEISIEFGERDTPFLRPDTRERLEWHMERKNLHQQCNLPQLVKKSLLAYLPPAPKLQKPLMGINQKLNILVIKDDLFFMSESNQHNLKKHIKKKIDQKKTGLPQRIVEFFKSIISCKPPRSDVVLHCYGVYPIPGCPSSSIKIIEDPRFTGCKELVTNASDLRETMSSQELKLGLKRCNDLNLQLIKKSCEARLGTIHPTVIQSWTVPGSNPNPSLYKIIEMAERSVAKRRLRMHFVGQDRISSIERNIRQKQLMFLLGNPIAHTVYLFEMMPHTHPLPPQIQGSRAAIEFADAETLFVEAAFKQCLERHIKVKRVQHVCGLPALFQASQKAFTPQGPICGPPQPATKFKGNREAIALYKEACFLGTFERKHLEIHIKKMVLQNTFGLPLKILDASLSN